MNRSISNANSFNHPRHEHPKRGHRDKSNVDPVSKRHVLASLEYATITDAIGIYKGTVEKSKTISVTTEDPAAVDALLSVGDAYKKAFNQECVMYTVANVPSLTFTMITIRETLRLIALFFITTLLDI